MPSIDKLSKLFKALADTDLHAAEEVALQIATDEDEKGHRTAARLLRGSLTPNGTRGTNGNQSLGQNHGTAFLAGALTRRFSPVQLEDVVLRRSTRKQLEDVAKEFKGQGLLAARGIRRRSKIILHGPPGCGKSLSAHALANKIGLPLYVVRFDSVIGAYLGQTAMNLRQLFHFAEVTACVLLFDEIDALGKSRGRLTDVGELDRIVIALMQELELSELNGFVIATSNLPGTLDLALWRRFDLAIPFPPPNRQEIAMFAKTKAKTFGVPLRQAALNRVLRLKNYSEIERSIEDEARRQTLGSL